MITSLGNFVKEVLSEVCLHLPKKPTWNQRFWKAWVSAKRTAKPSTDVSLYVYTLQCTSPWIFPPKFHINSFVLHFFHVALSSWCYLFLSPFFHNLLISYCTFFMLHFFHVSFSSCCPYSLLIFVFTMLFFKFFMFMLFFFSTFLILHAFLVTLYSIVFYFFKSSILFTVGLKIKSLFACYYFFLILHYHILFMLHLFDVPLSSSCTFLTF